MVTTSFLGEENTRKDRDEAWPMVIWSCWSRCDGDEVAGGKRILIDFIVALASGRSLDPERHTVSTSIPSSPTYAPPLGGIALEPKDMLRRRSGSLRLCLPGWQNESRGKT
jgi:hypothetical protein